jgi:hypothetical protein
MPTRGGGDWYKQGPPVHKWGPTVLHVCDRRLPLQSRRELRSLLNNPEDGSSRAAYVFVLSTAQIKSFTSNPSHSATVSQSFQLSVKIFSQPLLGSAKIFLRHCLNLISVALICWVIFCLEEGCITWHCWSACFKYKGVVPFVILV